MSILQREYELHKDEPRKASDVAEDSDDSAIKQTKFVSPSPEGKIASENLSDILFFAKVS